MNLRINHKPFVNCVFDMKILTIVNDENFHQAIIFIWKGLFSLTMKRVQYFRSPSPRMFIWTVSSCLAAYFAKRYCQNLLLESKWKLVVKSNVGTQGPGPCPGKIYIIFTSVNFEFEPRSNPGGASIFAHFFKMTKICSEEKHFNVSQSLFHDQSCL